MLKQVAEGVLIHQSELLENNSVVVQGRDGVLLVDAGITGAEMTCLANDLRELGRPVAAGFSRHPEGVADDVDVLIPGHGSVARDGEVRARIKLDRAYVEDLRDARVSSDPRVVSPKPGWEWTSGIHDGQARKLARTKHAKGRLTRELLPPQDASVSEPLLDWRRRTRVGLSRATTKLPVDGCSTKIARVRRLCSPWPTCGE
ncbi:hypothetical protein [Streptomyces sp. NBC_01124]|uniref:hypothetical protein n=1 Tax=Streptomyces sp. NBC_01124 TaxID=2903753 RepID=UPI00386CE4D4|nr:hypothetical protein OG368_07075 [Streptomyces sp. NBC_01124]